MVLGTPQDAWELWHKNLCRGFKFYTDRAVEFRRLCVGSCHFILKQLPFHSKAVAISGASVAMSFQSSCNFKAVAISKVFPLFDLRLLAPSWSGCPPAFQALQGQRLPFLRVFSGRRLPRSDCVLLEGAPIASEFQHLQFKVTLSRCHHVHLLVLFA